MADVLQKTRIGPADHGARMSLAEFARAHGEPGRLYELARGVIEVVDVPDLPHGSIVLEITRQFAAYEATHPGIVRFRGGGGEAAMQLEDLQSERHPDVSIYLSPPPDLRRPWDRWIPDIAIEVVSSTSVARDYEDKRDEYLAAGVREYWIVDPLRELLLVLRRRGGDWQEVTIPRSGAYATALLPGFALPLEAVFAAGEL